MKSNINPEDIVRRKGIDSYVSNGKVVHQLSISNEKRKELIHAPLYGLLLREQDNPLVEEGDYTTVKRDREGELYLTYEALDLPATLS
jgi:hypothetical protein